MSEQRVFRHTEVPPDLGTPNSGDDADAASEHNPQFLHAGMDFAEKKAPSSDWRPAEALLALRSEVNAMFPNRSKSSDGIVGDAKHKARTSDHNPWVDDGNIGVVTAIDITHDPKCGCDAGMLAEKLRAGKDKRIKYIIWNRRIANSSPIHGQPAWAWRKYTGANPHDHHMHVSVQPSKDLYNSKEPWQLKPAPVAAPGDGAGASAAASPATAPPAPGIPVAAGVAAPVASAGTGSTTPPGTAAAGPASFEATGDTPPSMQIGAAEESRSRTASQPKPKHAAAPQSQSFFQRLGRWFGFGG